MSLNFSHVKNFILPLNMPRQEILPSTRAQLKYSYQSVTIDHNVDLWICKLYLGGIL